MPDRGTTPVLGSAVALQRTLRGGLRVHALIAGRCGESDEVARQDLVNAGIDVRRVSSLAASSSLALDEAEHRIKDFRDRAELGFKAWLHYPTWVVALAPALLTLHHGMLTSIGFEYGVDVSRLALALAWSSFVALVVVRVLGVTLIRGPTRARRWPRASWLLPVAGPLARELDRAHTLACIGAELRDGVPLELAFLRHGETDAAREVLRGEPAHVALMASDWLASASPELTSAGGAPLAQGFETAAVRVSEGAIEAGRARAGAVAPVFVLISAVAVLWVAGEGLADIGRLMFERFGGAP